MGKNGFSNTDPFHRDDASSAFMSAILVAMKRNEANKKDMVLEKYNRLQAIYMVFYGLFGSAKMNFHQAFYSGGVSSKTNGAVSFDGDRLEWFKRMVSSATTFCVDSLTNGALEFGATVENLFKK